MRRAIWLAIPVTLVSAAAALLGSAAFAGGAKDKRPRIGGDVNFVSVCRFSHRAPDDPIVYPGQPGLSHDHSFVTTSPHFLSDIERQRPRPQCRRAFRQSSTRRASACSFHALKKSAWAEYWPPEESVTFEPPLVG